jgi:DNA-binding transcriptional regulator YhcF (GntR family)
MIYMEQGFCIPVALDAKTLEVIRAIVDETVSKYHKPDTRLFSRKEVAEKLGITLVTLDIWNKKGLIESHRVGGRVYYKQEAIDRAINKLQKFNPGNAA